MGNNSTRPPIIIIGMHRSGTSMITRMLEELGLFVGMKKQKNHEAVFFRKLNDWLLSQSGGRWDHPEPIKYLLTNTEVRALSVDYIRHLMKGPRIIIYLGWGKYMRYRTPENLDIPWGWKDPRNTFTLPLWIDLFPEAKIIHIYRNGVDVANSLKVRAEKKLARSKSIYAKIKPLSWLLPKLKGFTDTLNCASLEGGFSLWEKYLREARAHVRNLQDRAMELKYEDVLAEPHGALNTLARFCDLPITDAVAANLAAKVKKSRAYAYKDTPELQAFADQMAERLRVQSY